MLEIGKVKNVAVRSRVDGKLVIKRGPDGLPETKAMPSIVKRRTRDTLDGSFGRDRMRHLVVSLEPGDLIVIQPLGTRQKLKMSVFDVYRHMIRSAANKLTLEKPGRPRKRRPFV